MVALGKLWVFFGLPQTSEFKLSHKWWSTRRRVRTLIQPGEGGQKILETRSHLDRGRTTSFEKQRLCSLPGAAPRTPPVPASTRHQQKAARLGQVQAATPAEAGLPYDFFRFLKRPLVGKDVVMRGHNVLNFASWCTN